MNNQTELNPTLQILQSLINTFEAPSHLNDTLKIRGKPIYEFQAVTDYLEVGFSVQEAVDIIYKQNKIICASCGWINTPTANVDSCSVCSWFILFHIDRRKK